MKAIIYARWSSLEQSKGSSLERQMEICRRFCAEQGWEIASTLQDEGKSAYTGANISEGKLGELTKRVEQGLLREPTVLVVEQLDRISRLPPGQVVAWLQKVVGYGLAIATANDRLVLDTRKLEADPIGIVSTVFNAFRAYQESRHKSDRLAESWRIRRKNAEKEKRPITGACPAWLTLDKATNTFHLIPDRAEIVRRIFREHNDGYGKHKIAARLNADGVSTWGRGKRQGNGWHASYIQKILTNSAVVGEHQPHTRPRGGTRKPSGPPIQDYFPAVVEEITYSRANSNRTRLPGGAVKSTLANLLSGKTRCGVCGGKMRFLKKARAGTKKKNRVGEYVWTVGSDEIYFVCDNAKRRNGCYNVNNYNYLKVETGVVDRVNHLVLGDEQFANADEALEIEQEIAAAERHAAILRERTARARTLYIVDEDEGARGDVERLRREEAELQQRIQELHVEFHKAKGAVSPSEHVRRIKQFIGLINDADPEVRFDARRKTMAGLQQVIDFVNFDTDRKVTVVFLGGAHNVKLSDKGAVEWERSFLVELSEGDKTVNVNGVGEVVLPVATLRSGLVGDDPERESALVKLVERDQRFRIGMADIEADEQKAKVG